MKNLPDKSIDVIICDLPYGVSACKWDTIIPFDELWSQYNRICKGQKILFSSQPFTTHLIYSNIKNFKYAWVWEKNFSTNFLHAKRMPLRKTEDICVFDSGLYNPQKTDGHKPTQSAIGASNGKLWHGKNVRNYKGGDTTRYPTNILKFNAVDPKKRIHPTQKPIDLLEYLIKTYTNEGMTVLDNCAGSGTTAIACENTNRKWICIEKDEEIAYNSINRIQGE
jgi:site-specific DNA-methyltransferase (adenine-specific)